MKTHVECMLDLIKDLNTKVYILGASQEEEKVYRDLGLLGSQVILINEELLNIEEIPNDGYFILSRVLEHLTYNHISHLIAKIGSGDYPTTICIVPDMEHTYNYYLRGVKARLSTIRASYEIQNESFVTKESLKYDTHKWFVSYLSLKKLLGIQNYTSIHVEGFRHFLFSIGKNSRFRYNNQPYIQNRSHTPYLTDQDYDKFIKVYNEDPYTLCLKSLLYFSPFEIPYMLYRMAQLGFKRFTTQWKISTEDFLKTHFIDEEVPMWTRSFLTIPIINFLLEMDSIYRVISVNDNEVTLERMR